MTSILIAAMFTLNSSSPEELWPVDKKAAIETVNIFKSLYRLQYLSSSDLIMNIRVHSSGALPVCTPT
ncbi:MAG: hypothetical protein ACUVTX_08035 [Bacteroidales bacterium]